MNIRQAIKLKVGDEVTAPKMGVYLPAKITKIYTREDHPDMKGHLPLFNLAGHPHPVTYRALLRFIL